MTVAGEGTRFIIISGLSGSGKSTAIKVFEDLGFYCVDNLPIALFPTFIELFRLSERRGLTKVALGVDIREGDFLREFPGVYGRLRRDVAVEILFLEASRTVLARRYGETRRLHPLARECGLAEGIRREAEALEPVHALADRTVDTSDMNVHELRKLLTRMYAPGESPSTSLSIMSFGYKHGLPYDADIVFDARFLPNPFFVDELRPHSGRNRDVRKYVLSFPDTREFLERVEGLLLWAIPRYVAEGRPYLHVAVGCTGGRHRSVAVVEELKKRLVRAGHAVGTVHRDIGKEN
jgi:UPF0042 nucleotide-binding protein